MEPITIAVICVTVFGVAAGLTAFIRQLIISRDKLLNDKAQKKALRQESTELKNLRDEMSGFKRFDSHYQVLGNNKDAIQYLDQKIEEILKKKFELVERYGVVALKESSAIASGLSSEERKQICDQLKCTIDSEMAFYDGELQQLQKRRSALWDTHKDLQEYLLAQEKLRNEHLDTIYQRHSDVLEKVYIRHNENSEHFAKDGLEASTDTFKSMFTVPIQYLMSLFKITGTNIDLGKVAQETSMRDKVAEVEKSINDDGSVPMDSSRDVSVASQFREPSV